MKTIFAVLLFASITANAQPSVDLGFTSRMQGTMKVAYEQQTGFVNTELATRISMGNMHPIVSIQSGYSTTNEFQNANIRFMMGGFYHTGIMLIGKEAMCKKMLVGGSVRYELNHGLACLEYNGETINLTLGFIFKSRYK